MTTTSPDGEATPADPGAIAIAAVEALRARVTELEIGVPALAKWQRDDAEYVLQSLRARVTKLARQARAQYKLRMQRTAQLETAEAREAVVAGALEFYADPDTYMAIGFLPDPPCGDFMDDFEELEGELGHPDGGTWMKPGKRARTALAATPAQAPERARAVEEVLKWARQTCSATNWGKAETTTAPGPGNKLVSALAKLDALGKEESSHLETDSQ